MNTQHVNIRPATRADLAPLTFFFDTALRNDYFMRRGQLNDMLASTCHQVYIAAIDCVLVGIAITTRHTRLVNVLVHPAYRGVGIGRALLDHTRATEVRVKRDMHTGDPRGFYAALGFRSTGKTNPKGNIELMRRPRVPPNRNATPTRKTAPVFNRCSPRRRSA